MYSSNYQKPISPKVVGYGINYNQPQVHQNIPRQSFSPHQQYNQQYQYQHYPQQQYSYQQYNNVNPNYGIQHLQQSQTQILKNNYPTQTNVYQQQQQPPNYQSQVMVNQYQLRTQLPYQNTNYLGTTPVQVPRERIYSGTQNFQTINCRNLSSPYSRPSEVKVVQNNYQQYHGQQIIKQVNDYAPENPYVVTANKPINHLTLSPTTVQYGNYRKPDMEEITMIENTFKHLEQMAEKQKSNIHVIRNVPPNTIENQQQIEVNPHANTTSNTADRKNSQTLPNQPNVLVQNPSVIQPIVQQNIDNEVIIQDLNVEYDKAINKLKDNQEKIKTILERQQIDGKITDAKERIERLERIINLQEKVSLTFIHRFISATDAKIMDENLCKPVMDAFDNIVKAGDQYRSFQIPHFDPFHELKEKFLRLPDAVNNSKLDEDDDPTPYYLRKDKDDNNKVLNKKENDVKRRKLDTEVTSVDNQSEVIQQIDERTKIVIGSDGKEHLTILCHNDKYLTLSDVITKDLKLCGKFQVDPNNIPISDHYRGVNFIITFDKIGIPPLHLHIPIDYPKGICSIVNPNYNSEITDLSLHKLISRVEQALPSLSVYRRIQNIAITWMNLAMNV
uniref:Mediator of RNA polymerase II transcription subunit 15 n=1 Tax=Strongyloides venezuelensis TaxID=75913 RepID=A0A0K0G4F5_STRVS